MIYACRIIFGHLGRELLWRKGIVVHVDLGSLDALPDYSWRIWAWAYMGRPLFTVVHSPPSGLDALLPPSVVVCMHVRKYKTTIFRRLCVESAKWFCYL
jgi:hypothetical protein